MSKSKPDKTISQLLEEFLADQKARLSPKTFSRYEGSIHLYRSYLESYWPGHDQKEYAAITKAGGTYCETYGAEDIASGFGEFLDYFMPMKVIGSDETMKAAGTVIKKLAKWLAVKGYHLDEEGLTTERVREAARDLPATQKLFRALDDWIDQNDLVDSRTMVEGHFLIQRIGPKAIWLETMTGEPVIGPIPVPTSIARACRVGWDIGGAVASTPKGWRLVEVWNISP